jgi:hypothetical protein
MGDYLVTASPQSRLHDFFDSRASRSTVPRAPLERMPNANPCVPAKRRPVSSNALLGTLRS